MKDQLTPEILDHYAYTVRIAREEKLCCVLSADELDALLATARRVQEVDFNLKTTELTLATKNLTLQLVNDRADKLESQLSAAQAEIAKRNSTIILIAKNYRDFRFVYQVATNALEHAKRTAPEQKD